MNSDRRCAGYEIGSQQGDQSPLTNELFKWNCILYEVISCEEVCPLCKKVVLCVVNNKVTLYEKTVHLDLVDLHDILFFPRHIHG